MGMTRIKSKLKRYFVFYLAFLIGFFLLPMMWPTVFSWDLMTIAWISVGTLAGVLTIMVVEKLRSKNK